MASHTNLANQQFGEIKHLYDNGGSAELAQYHLHEFERHLKPDNRAVLKSSHDEAIRMVTEMKKKEQKPD
jgi:hypothetical protein